MRSAGAFEVLGGMRSTHDMCCATQGNEEMQNPSNCKQSHVQAQPVLPQYLPMWNDSGREKRRHRSVACFSGRAISGFMPMKRTGASAYGLPRKCCFQRSSVGRYAYNISKTYYVFNYAPPGRKQGFPKLPWETCSCSEALSRLRMQWIRAKYRIAILGASSRCGPLRLSFRRVLHQVA